MFKIVDFCLWVSEPNPGFYSQVHRKTLMNSALVMP